MVPYYPTKRENLRSSSFKFNTTAITLNICCAALLNMDIKTQDGTVFKVRDVPQQQFISIAPLDFLALLLEDNLGLPWKPFNRGNITEVIDILMSRFRVAPSATVQLHPSFESSDRKVQ